MLGALGRREEALAAAEEAVRLYRALAEACPDAFTTHLAWSLATLATMLGALGRREEALAAAEEAVRLCRALAEERPDAFTPDLALSLNTLANRRAISAGARMLWRRPKKRSASAAPWPRRARTPSRPTWPCRSTISPKC